MQHLLIARAWSYNTLRETAQGKQNMRGQQEHRAIIGKEKNKEKNPFTYSLCIRRQRRWVRTIRTDNIHFNRLLFTLS